MKLRGCWCDIILNVHGPTEDKTDDTNANFYEQLSRLFDQIPKYRMKILLGDFHTNVVRDDIFNPTSGNHSLYQISNDDGVRRMNFPHSVI
jgi:hypothetical protein